MRTHIDNCDCVSCNTNRYLDELELKSRKSNFLNAQGKIDYADAIQKPATYFYDSTLVAREPVLLQRSPSDSAEVLKKFPKGTNVGKIYSHVVRDGHVWWQVNWFSGSHAGWVKHDPKLFDAKIVEQTASGLKHDQTMEQLKNDQEETDRLNPLYALGDLTKGVSGVISSIGNSIIPILIITVIIGFIALSFKTSS